MVQLAQRRIGETDNDSYTVIYCLYAYIYAYMFIHIQWKIKNVGIGLLN